MLLQASAVGGLRASPAALRGAGVVLGGQHHVGKVDGAFALDDGALGMGLAVLARVALDHLQALDQNALLLGR